jgi:hypothetical protein
VVLLSMIVCARRADTSPRIINAAQIHPIWAILTEWIARDEKTMC